MTDIISTYGGTNLTKSLMESRKAHLLQEVRAGRSSALPVYTQAKFILETMKQVVEDLKQAAMDEAAKYPKGDRKILGVSFDLREGSGTPDYLADAEYARLVAAAEARLELLKQAATSKAVIVDPNSGEVVPKVPMNYGSPTISITFPR